MNKNYKRDLLERLLKFSVMIIKLASGLPKTPAGFAIAGQIIRSATSIGANCEEAQDASSRKDFLNRMSISLREAKETKYWLKVIRESGLLSVNRLQEAIDECDQIVAILVSTVKSLKK